MGIWPLDFSGPADPADDFDLAEQVAKRAKTDRKPVTGWMDVVKDIEEITWQEEREAKRQTGLKRWCEIIKGLPTHLGTVQDLLSLDDVAAQLRMVQDLVTDKAPDTLAKRANSSNDV